MRYYGASSLVVVMTVAVSVDGMGRLMLSIVVVINVWRVVMVLMGVVRHVCVSLLVILDVAGLFMGVLVLRVLIAVVRHLMHSVGLVVVHKFVVMHDLVVMDRLDVFVVVLISVVNSLMMSLVLLPGLRLSLVPLGVLVLHRLKSVVAALDGHMGVVLMLLRLDRGVGVLNWLHACVRVLNGLVSDVLVVHSLDVGVLVVHGLLLFVDVVASLFVVRMSVFVVVTNDVVVDNFIVMLDSVVVDELIVLMGDVVDGLMDVLAVRVMVSNWLVLGVNMLVALMAVSFMAVSMAAVMAVVNFILTVVRLVDGGLVDGLMDGSLMDRGSMVDGGFVGRSGVSRGSLVDRLVLLGSSLIVGDAEAH